MSSRRLLLIERNRVLLVAKLFPWGLLCLNGVFYMARIAAGILAAARSKGEVSRFPGWTGKMRIAWTLLRADWEALKMAPRMLRKRASLQPIRKLTSSQVMDLLRRHQISLKDLSELAN